MFLKQEVLIGPEKGTLSLEGLSRERRNVKIEFRVKVNAMITG